MSQLFAKGTEVIIKGLKNAGQYNGKRGKVDSVLTHDGRIMIKLEEGQVIKVKPDNLDRCDEDSDDSIPDLVSSSDSEGEDHRSSKRPALAPAKRTQAPPRASTPSVPAAAAARAPNVAAAKPASPASPAAAKAAPAASKPAISAAAKAAVPSSLPSDDDDEPPDLISSSSDDDTFSPKPVAGRNAGIPAPVAAGAPKAGKGSGSGAAAAKTSAAAAGPAPAAPAKMTKSELLSLFNKFSEEGKACLSRAEFQDACKKFFELGSSLEKYCRETPGEFKEFQPYLARAFTWLSESYLQLGQHDECISNSEVALSYLKKVENPADAEIELQAKLCHALAVKGRGEYKLACLRFQDCEKGLKARFGDSSEHELVRKARLARTWCTQYVNLPRGPQVRLERTDKKENINRIGTLMNVSSKLVLALNNGTDQIVNPSDFSEIQDAADGAREIREKPKADEIVEGMTVIIGGNDTSKDYGLEGIVLNTSENMQATGGKMCHVMLNDTQILMVPIAHVLTGKAAQEAVARKAALKSLESSLAGAKVAPSASELMDILKDFKKHSWGVKKMLNELKSSHPHWEVSEKRLKKVLKDMEYPNSEALSRSNTEEAEPHSGEQKDGKDEAVNFSSTLVAVKDYVMPHLECPLCMEEMYKNSNGTLHHVPFMIKVCGHSLCDSCVRDLDKHREEAAFKAAAKSGRPNWPKCPTCNAELPMLHDNSSCAVKNYLLCDVIDILHDRAKPRGH